MSWAVNTTRGIALSIVALIVIGCARGTEFTAPEQQGASHQGIYPKFSNKPKAATAQFSEQEKQDLTNKLDSEASALRKVRGPEGSSAANLVKAKEDARREAEDAVRQIEQSGNNN